MPISAAVDPSAVARVVGIETKFSDLRGGRITYLPQRVAIVGQGATASTYASTKVQITSAVEAGQTFGFGSPVHLAAKQLLPSNGDGVGAIPVTVYPLQDDGSGLPGLGSVTPVGTSTEATTIRVVAGGVKSKFITIPSGSDAAAATILIVAGVNAEVDMPVIAAESGGVVATMTTKWYGASALQISISIEGAAPAGLTLAITALTVGTANPDIQPALDQFGSVWETMVVNCLELSDDTALDAFQVFGESRWGALERKPFLAFTGASDTMANVTAITSLRTTDRTNVSLNSPGSPDAKFITAARMVARIVKVAGSNPAQDYGNQQALGLTPGLDSAQWDYAERNAAILGGASTSESIGGVVHVADTVTMYHPAGDPAPAYRYVTDVIKLMNVMFNLDVIFAGTGWVGAPLIPDNQATVNRSAKQPKAAVAAVCAMLDSLGLEAIISDPDTAKANTVAEIDSGNPKRLNVATIVQLSGTVNIISVDLNFGFYFGGV